MKWVGSKQDIGAKESKVGCQGGKQMYVSVRIKPGMLRRLNPTCQHLYNPSKTSSKWLDPYVREDQ